MLTCTARKYSDLSGSCNNQWVLFFHFECHCERHSWSIHFITSSTLLKVLGKLNVAKLYILLSLNKLVVYLLVCLFFTLDQDSFSTSNGKFKSFTETEFSCHFLLSNLEKVSYSCYPLTFPPFFSLYADETFCHWQLKVFPKGLCFHHPDFKHVPLWERR